jgi:hypothetical protein
MSACPPHGSNLLIAAEGDVALEDLPAAGFDGDPQFEPGGGEGSLDQRAGRRALGREDEDGGGTGSRALADGRRGARNDSSSGWRALRLP